ncbi:stage II sporulation protein P [Pelotomaculum propionicicum]|uniref:stage II sporulation protein P n=1 Tax=Pelotomaculum propionicicum TaxID=258475 RepID=UPI003B7BB83B
MKNSRYGFVFYTGVLLVGLSLLIYSANRDMQLWPVVNTAGLFNKETPDHIGGTFTTILDEQGNMLSMMSRNAYVGDELYTSEGNSYRVSKVQGDTAEAVFLGMDSQIVAYNDFFSAQEVPVATNVAEKKGNIAVYHSHTDESYVPSDGTETIPFKGGIYQVGKAMVDKLQGKGVTVNYDQTAHDPHDNNAYVRSRRTAANLMKSNPAAIFDVHRDGVPDPAYYRAEVSGKDVAKLRLVVGRQNPRMDSNMDFAKRMMAAANNLHPKVVKEIFVAKGDYNQDLSPTALLIEAGTHTNSKEQAEKGVAFFTEAVPAALGISGAPAAAPTEPGRTTGAGGGWKAAGWILGITVVLGLGFILINSGSLGNAKNNISGFAREITGLFPRRAARKPGMSGGDQDKDKES